MSTTASQTRPFDQTEINWDKLNKAKFYAVGAGIFSGITVALYPISVVKTRLQVVSKDSVERNAYSVIKGLLKEEGVPGLYRGFGTVITGAIPARIIFLTALETTKVAAFKMVEPLKVSEPTQAAIANGVAGMTASLLSQAVFVPIDVVSQKLMVQGFSGHTSYSGGLDVARKVLKTDGIRGLYRGFGLSVMTYSPSSAVWWASYGSSQRAIWKFLGHGTDSDERYQSQLSIMLVQSAGGIIAGATASCITTPLDTIKTRLQDIGPRDSKSTRQRSKGPKSIKPSPSPRVRSQASGRTIARPSGKGLGALASDFGSGQATRLQQTQNKLGLQACGTTYRVELTGPLIRQGSAS